MGIRVKKLKKGTKFEDLKMETKYKFEADGMISPSTIKQVRSFIDSQYGIRSTLPRGLKKGWNFRVIQAIGGPVWMTGEGAFPKRVSRHIYKDHGVKMHVDDVRYIGNIAKQNTAAGEMIFDFTRRITWSSGDYGDGGSCFWTDYKDALGAMMGSGVGAIRLYNPLGKGVGRAWFYPLSSRQQFVLFNAYGPLQARVIANHLCQMLGDYQYKQVRINQDWSGYGIYLNSDGYVIHRKSISGNIRLPYMSRLEPIEGRAKWIREKLPKAGEGWFERD